MNISNGLEAICMTREAEKENERHEDTEDDSEGDAV